MAAWSAEIANEFIRRARTKGKNLTQMQLQKLVYIAHGWHLAITGNPLTHEAPQAWDFGPVYHDLWYALREYGRSPITREIKYSEFPAGRLEAQCLEDDAIADLSQTEIDVIDQVYDNYGNFHAFQLSALTHQDGTPWTVVFADGAGKSNSIDADLIREHFVEIATRKAA